MPTPCRGPELLLQYNQSLCIGTLVVKLTNLVANRHGLDVKLEPWPQNPTQSADNIMILLTSSTLQCCGTHGLADVQATISL